MIPEEMLHVGGTIRSDALAGGGSLCADVDGNIILGGLCGGGAAADADWTIAVVDMYSAVSGNVGIGTSTPMSKLAVGDDGAERFAG